MKKIQTSLNVNWLVSLLILLLAGCSAKNNPLAENDDKVIEYETASYIKASPEKMQWFNDAKFGLFIHWGVYAVPAGLWSKNNTFESRFDGDDSDLYSPHNYSERLLHATNMPLSEYEKIPALFDWSDFNAQDYIDLCFESGQRYIVITSKHHDGFAMWRSKASEWNIGDATPYGRESGRDPLKELADACQATKTNGSPWEIKMCFYYSHCADWHEDDAAAFNYKRRTDPSVEVFQNYLDRKVKPQVTELLTEYEIERRPTSLKILLIIVPAKIVIAWVM
nr:alpha-L-fucosidase [Sunxiuqinia sp.]